MTANPLEPVRVGIVDGHELSRQGLEALMTQREPDVWRVVYAGADPREAVAAKPDVVVLNLEDATSGPAGLAALDTLQGFPVVVTGSEGAPDDIRRALMKGALGHVTRSHNYAHLDEALRSAVRGELHITPELADILSGTPNVPALSPRELTALELYASGLTMGAVAERMGVSSHTAREYIDRVRDKYGILGRSVRTRTELYAAAVRDGFIKAQ
jgi:DNA-binding NarL/FixJ family response regulator